MDIQEIKDKYLVQFFDEVAECGNGIIVGKYLITAGHVADKPVLKARTKDGDSLSLDKCLALRNDQAEETFSFKDFAVYELNGIESPLTLAQVDAETGERFSSLAINPMDDLTTNISHSVQETEAKVDCVMGNFIRCKMDIRLKTGNSGSPIIKDGKVYGILSRGEESKENPEMDGRFCWFMSAKEIREVLDI